MKKLIFFLLLIPTLALAAGNQAVHVTDSSGRYNMAISQLGTATVNIEGTTTTTQAAVNITNLTWTAITLPAAYKSILIKTRDGGAFLFSTKPPELTTSPFLQIAISPSQPQAQLALSAIAKMETVQRL